MSVLTCRRLPSTAVGIALWIAVPLVVCWSARGTSLHSTNYSISESMLCSGGNCQSPSFSERSSAAPPLPPDLMTSNSFELSVMLPFLIDRAPAVWRYVLEPGWNLKGAPVNTDQTIDTIFQTARGTSILHSMPAVWSGNGYNRKNGSDRLNATEGFWVFSYWGGESREFTGQSPQSGDGLVSQLQQGWNLYSPPGYASRPPDNRIIVVWWWDPFLQEYVEIPAGANLLPLEGYWIYFQ